MSHDPLVQRALRLLTQPIERDKPKETMKREEFSIRPGSLITWTSGDGSTQEGFVDFLHMDQDGTQWAFVSYGKNWAAINLKVVKVVTA